MGENPGRIQSGQPSVAANDGQNTAQEPTFPFASEDPGNPGNDPGLSEYNRINAYRRAEELWNRENHTFGESIRLFGEVGEAARSKVERLVRLATGRDDISVADLSRIVSLAGEGKFQGPGRAREFVDALRNAGVRIALDEEVFDDAYRKQADTLKDAAEKKAFENDVLQNHRKFGITVVPLSRIEAAFSEGADLTEKEGVRALLKTVGMKNVVDSSGPVFLGTMGILASLGHYLFEPYYEVQRMVNFERAADKAETFQERAQFEEAAGNARLAAGLSAMDKVLWATTIYGVRVPQPTVAQARQVSLKEAWRVRVDEGIATRVSQERTAAMDQALGKGNSGKITVVEMGDVTVEVGSGSWNLGNPSWGRLPGVRLQMVGGGKAVGGGSSLGGGSSGTASSGGQLAGSRPPQKIVFSASPETAIKAPGVKAPTQVEPRPAQDRWITNPKGSAAEGPIGDPKGSPAPISNPDPRAGMPMRFAGDPDLTETVRIPRAEIEQALQQGAANRLKKREEAVNLIQQLAARTGVTLSGEQQQEFLQALESGALKIQEFRSLVEHADSPSTAALEEQLGKPRKEWPGELLKQPEGFPAQIRAVVNLRGYVSDIVRFVSEGTPAEQFMEPMVAAFTENQAALGGVPPQQAVEQVIRLARTAQSTGILGASEGISAPSFVRLLTSFYTRGVAPVVSEARLAEAEATQGSVQEKTAAFLKAVIRRDTPTPETASGTSSFVSWGVLKDECLRIVLTRSALGENEWNSQAYREMQSGVVMGDDNFGRREDFLVVRDHHGPYAQSENSTMQSLKDFEDALRAVGGEAAVKNPTDAQRRAAIARLNVREFTSTNAADGGKQAFLYQHQDFFLQNPARRSFLRDATYFEDFTAFGSMALPKPGEDLQAWIQGDPAKASIVYQLAVFQRYGEILAKNGVQGSDRFPAEKSEAILKELSQAEWSLFPKGEDLSRLSPEVLAKANQFTTDLAKAKTLLQDPRVKTSDDGRIVIFDLKVLGELYRATHGGDLSIFAQWLSVPRAHERNVQITDNNGVIIVATNSRPLLSGKSIESILPRVREAEIAAGGNPGPWGGKPGLAYNFAGSRLKPAQVKAIIEDPNLGLFSGGD